MDLIIQLGLSRSESDNYYQNGAGSRGMANPVIILVSQVGMNGVLHVYILSWIVGTCLFHDTTEVICQHTGFHPSL